MKRLVVLAVLFSLAISFAALQPAPVAAQSQNCYVIFRNNITPAGGYFFRAVQGTPPTVVSNIVFVPAGAEGRLTLNKGVFGTVGLEYATAIAGPWTFDISIFGNSCTDNNNEFGGSCDKLGVDVADVAAFSGATVRLRVFKNDQVVLQQDHVFPFYNSFQVVVPTDNDPNAYYSYDIRCVGNSGVCGYGNVLGTVNASAAPGTLMASGPLTYLCTSACGPSLAGAPLGRMLATVPLHAAPNAGAASPTFSAEAGKTFKMLGTQGGFTRIALGCQSYWVPSDAIAQCADPLCRN